MKKGKYIDYNILLACLSKKPTSNNEQHEPGGATGTGFKSAVVMQVTTVTQLIA